MTHVVQVVVDGMSAGIVYVMLALGLSLVFSIIRASLGASGLARVSVWKIRCCSKSDASTYDPSDDSKAIR